jgi:MFS family permease
MVTEKLGNASGLRQNRDWWWLWFGQAISVLGDEVFAVTLMLWIATVLLPGEQSAPLAVTAVVMAETLPVVLLSPIAGVGGDRWNRRHIMLIADAVRCVLIAVLAGIVFAAPALPHGALLAITWTVTALASGARQFFNPARFGMLASVVADQDRERAASIAMGTQALAGIAGPSIGAVLLITAGAGWAMMFNAVSFLVSFLAVAKVRTGAGRNRRATPAADASMWREFKDGLRYVAGNRTVKVVVLTTAAVWAASSGLDPLEIFFVIQNLNGSAALFGVLGTVAAVGAVAGAALITVLGKRLSAPKVYAYGVVATGVALVCYSRMTTPQGAIIVMVVYGVTLAGVDSMFGPLLMRSTPEQLLGRVSSVLQPISQVASMVSMWIMVWLAGTVLHGLNVSVSGVHFGPIDTIFTAGGVLIVLTGLLTARALTRGAVSRDHNGRNVTLPP